MGKGIEIARADAPEHAALMDELKDQLLIAFLRRLTNEGTRDLTVPIAEVDATGCYTLSFRVDFDRRDFIFTLKRKQ